MADVALYLRLSKADGDLGKDFKDESYSIENQRKLLKDYLQSSGELQGTVKEYIDDGYSGTNFNRPAFIQMVEDAKSGKINVILVKDLSRLGRDYIGVGDYLEQIFPLIGVRVIAVNSHYDSNQYVGDTIGLDMSITNLVNTLYSRDISKKFRSAIHTKWKQGVSTNSKAPFGYRKLLDKKWEVDKEAAEVVRLIFDLALQGYRIMQIVNVLNEKDLPTPGKLRYLRGENLAIKKVDDREWLWEKNMVGTIIKNYTYTGALIQGKTYSVRVCDKRRRKTNPTQQIIIENHHKAIISHEEFEQAQGITRTGKEMGFRKDSGFSLRGKIRCGNCGLNMKYRNGKNPVVFCQHKEAAGTKSTCKRIKYPATEIEKVVLDALKKEIEIFYEISEQFGNMGKDDVEATILKEVKKKLEILKAEKIRQYEAYAEGVLPREIFFKKKQILTDKIEELQKRYSLVSKIDSKAEAMQREINSVHGAIDKDGSFDKLTRQMAEIFVEQVTIYDSYRINITFKFEKVIEEFSDYLQQKKEKDNVLSLSLLKTEEILE